MSHTQWSDWLRDDRFRVVSIEEEQLGEWSCYHVVRVIEDDDSVGEGHLWIAPDADFAVLRTETLSIDKADCKHGYRSIRTWEGFDTVEGGAFLPALYRSDSYEYGRGADTPWTDITHVRIREMTCVPDPVANPLAVGVVENMTDAGKAREYQWQRAPWHHALNVFTQEPLPPDDPAFALTNAKYLQQLDGTELAETQARYGL